MKPPLVIVALICALFGGVPRIRRAGLKIDWAETFAEFISSLMVGLGVGAAIAFMLVPFVYWPSRRNPRSIFDRLGQPDWIPWVFLGALLIPLIVAGAVTRVVFEPGTALNSSALAGSDAPDRESPIQKAGRFLGNLVIWILVLVPGWWLVLYGLACVERQRIFNPRSLRVTQGQDAEALGWIYVGLGIAAMGEGAYLKSEQPIYRFLGWGLACLSVGAGIHLMLR